MTCLTYAVLMDHLKLLTDLSGRRYTLHAWRLQRMPTPWLTLLLLLLHKGLVCQQHLLLKIILGQKLTESWTDEVVIEALIQSKELRRHIHLHLRVNHALIT